MAGDRNFFSASQAFFHLSPKTLRTNPFTTYRDPETGRWVVVKQPHLVGERLEEWMMPEVSESSQIHR